MDPFHYYSIPGVRAASVTLKDEDYSDVNALCHGVSHVSLTSQQPNSQHSAASSTKVARRPCVSFECHTDIMMEDMFDNLSDDEFSLLDDDDLGFFLR